VGQLHKSVAGNEFSRSVSRRCGILSVDVMNKRRFESKHVDVRKMRAVFDA